MVNEGMMRLALDMEDLHDISSVPPEATKVSKKEKRAVYARTSPEILSRRCLCSLRNFLVLELVGKYIAVLVNSPKTTCLEKIDHFREKFTFQGHQGVWTKVRKPMQALPPLIMMILDLQRA